MKKWSGLDKPLHSRTADHWIASKNGAASGTGSSIGSSVGYSMDASVGAGVGWAWVKFKQLRPTAKVEQLIENSVEKILYFSAAISADSVHRQYDVPHLGEKAKAPEGFH